MNFSEFTVKFWFEIYPYIGLLYTISISQALESLMCQKLKMLHNFWFMDQKLFWLGSMHTEFNADSDAKWVFSKFSIFQVNIPLRNFELNFAIFRKLRGQKKSKFHFLGQFLTLKNMVTKFFRNSNFSDFLGSLRSTNDLWTQWINDDSDCWNCHFHLQSNN